MLRQVIDEFLLAQGTISAEQLADPTLKMTDLDGLFEHLFLIICPQHS